MLLDTAKAQKMQAQIPQGADANNGPQAPQMALLAAATDKVQDAQAAAQQSVAVRGMLTSLCITLACCLPASRVPVCLSCSRLRLLYLAR